MQTFTGLDYIKIDVANSFGLDRLPWAERIHWVNNNEPDLEKLRGQTNKSIAYAKAVRALRQAQAGEIVKHQVNLDATASGIQIMSAMSGCISGAKTVNLVNTGEREDVYDSMARRMTKICEKNFTRDDLKKPIMTFFYGSTAKPKEIFGEEGPELEAFYEALKTELPGAYQLRNLFLGLWEPDLQVYEWAMPDGHYAYVPVITPEEKGLEIDEENHFRFTMRVLKCKPKEQGLALAANIVHSVDAWVCRLMVKRAHAQGFRISPIHDCFYVHPNYANQLRQNYIDIMAELAEMNMVRIIVSQLKEMDFRYRKLSNDLPALIRESEYALS